MNAVGLDKKQGLVGLAVANVGWVMLWICVVQYGMHALIDFNVSLELVLSGAMVVLGLSFGKKNLEIAGKLIGKKVVSDEEREDCFGEAFRIGVYGMITCLAGLFFTVYNVIFLIGTVGTFLQTVGMYGFYSRFENIEDNEKVRVRENVKM